MTVRIRKLPARYVHDADNEEQRLREVRRLDMLDGLSDDIFDGFTTLLATALRVPIAVVSIVDRDKVWFKSSRSKVVAVQRDLSFCSQTICGADLLIVEDATRDGRFSAHPAVRAEDGVRFYAGTALRGPKGTAIGSCCVMDTVPRHPSRTDTDVLRRVGALIERQMTERDTIKGLREVLESHALADPMTGLPSMLLFQQRVDDYLSGPRGMRQHHMIACVRLRRYDALDSAIGRDRASHVVTEIAQRLHLLAGGEGILGQVREDEVAALLPQRGDDGMRCLHELHEWVHKPLVLGTESFTVSATIGAAVYPRDGLRASELVRRARIALRSEVLSDESVCRLYSPQLSTRTDNEFKLEAAVTRCVERGNIDIAYQPKVSLSSRQITAGEALLRLRDDEIGDISPAIAIPLADRVGLTNQLGTLVITRVIEQISQWRDLEAGFCIGINIAGAQLCNPNFPRILLATLDRFGVSARRINLEITEGSLIADIEHAISVMDSLRRHGVSFSIDDFGTGFSSLGYLRRMPLSVLKIDRSFVQHIPHSRNDATIAASLVALGHSLGLKVVAEGAETSAQVTFLAELGCDEVQGYALFPPLAASDFIQLLTNKFPIQLPLDAQRRHA